MAAEPDRPDRSAVGFKLERILRDNRENADLLGWTEPAWLALEQLFHKAGHNLFPEIETIVWIITQLDESLNQMPQRIQP